LLPDDLACSGQTPGDMMGKMPQETRSLWEQFDSEVEPWRRGRTALILIALFNFVLQILGLASMVMLGDIEQFVAFATVLVFFWLLFYFIWIGVHWIRWIAGAWAALAGFCFLIWGWRDNNGFELFFACTNLLTGSYLCLSSSVYFFAKRQQKRRSWFYSLVVAGVFGLLFLSFYLGGVGMVGYKTVLAADACRFADEAAQRIYVDQDRDWMLAHVTAGSLSDHGRERLRDFLEENKRGLRHVSQISPAAGSVRLHFEFPFNVESQADVACEGESAQGPFRSSFILVSLGGTWQIDRAWWQYLPMPTPSPSTSKLPH
jgi:hypothetical protein